MELYNPHNNLTNKITPNHTHNPRWNLTTTGCDRLQVFGVVSQSPLLSTCGSIPYTIEIGAPGLQHKPGKLYSSYE